MYAPTSIPFVSRTRATLRSAEFGFFGVIVETRVQTPRFCGAPWRAGVFVFALFGERPLRISWFTVGMARLGGLLLRSYRGRQTKGRRSARLQPNRRGMVANTRLRRQTRKPLRYAVFADPRSPVFA